MEKKLLLVIGCLFLLQPFCWSQQRYVSSSGTSSNNGTSEATPWSLSHAVVTATAGMTVHVKAGNYGNLQLIQSNNGTSTGKIHFKGYTNSPNDLNSFQGSTFTRNTPLNASTMPLIAGTFDGNNRTSGTAITVNGQFVVFENFQVTKKEMGIWLNGSDSEVINLVADTLGDFSGQSGNGFDDYSGYGVRISAPNCKVLNTLIRNTGAEGIHFRDNGNYGLTQWSEVFCNNTINPNDYYLFSSSTHHNRFENCTVYRESGLTHSGHGLLNKFEAHDNVFENCTVIGTNIESTFGSFNNLWDNITLDGHWDGINNANNDAGAITFGKNVHGEELRNIRIDNYRLGLAFSGWNEPAGVSMPNNAGYDCTFKNIVVSNVLYAFSGNEFQNNGWPTYDHSFYNLTVSDVSGRLFITNRPMNGFEFYDCIFNNVNGLKIHSGGYNYDLNANTIFSVVNVTGGSLGTADLNPYKESNVTAITPPFENPTSQNFSLTTNILDIGFPHSENTTDILGNIRNSPFSVGAYEFDSADVTAPSQPGSLAVVSTTESTIDINWDASSDDVGVSGYAVSLNSVQVGTTTDLNYQYTGLTENTAYNIQVTAFDAANNNSAPASLTATTDPASNTNLCASPSPVDGLIPSSILVSEHDGNIPCNMMDGELGTRWSALGDGEWAVFDLGSKRQFDQLQIAFFFGNTRKTFFDIQVSNDSQSWTTLNNQLLESSGNSLTLENFDFPLQNSRYIRYVGHGNSQSNNDWNSLTEVRIQKTAPTCPDYLPNGDASVTITSTVDQAGLDSTTGAPGNGNGECGIQVINNDNGQPWARRTISIDMAANNITTGDQVFFSIDGYGANGARVEVVKNDQPNSYDLEHDFGGSWGNYSGTHTVTAGTNTLDIWLFSNFSSQNPGTAFYDNLVIQKVGSSCPDSLTNGDASVSITSTANQAGLDSTTNAPGNGNNECGIQVINNDNGQPWARRTISIDMAANNITTGDQVFFSIDGYGANGARVEVVKNDQPNSYDLEHDFGGSWGGYSGTHTVTAGTNTLDIWLFSNFSSQNPGTAFYDNLVIQKVGGTSLQTSFNPKYSSKKHLVENVRVFPNPSTNEIQVVWAQKKKYATFELFSLTGALVKKGIIHESQKAVTIPVHDIQNGVYLLNLANEKGERSVTKIVKE